MVKYDGPAFFRKKGVNFDQQKSLLDEKRNSLVHNDEFTPAIKQRKEAPLSTIKSDVKPAVEMPQDERSLNSQATEAPMDEAKTGEATTSPRYKMPRSTYRAPQRKMPVLNKLSNRHQVEETDSMNVTSKLSFNSNHVRSNEQVSNSTQAVSSNISQPSNNKPISHPSAPTSNLIGNNDVGYHFPSPDLLPDPIFDEGNMDEWVETQIQRLDDALADFDVDANIVNWTVGPTVTQFEIELGRGVKVNKITNLTDDLKLQLAARDIRIEAPIPGKNTVGIEIPNLNPRPVPLGEIIKSDAFEQSDSPLTIALGVDLFGQPQTYDLRKMPHGLIAGATGSGKSVFINSVLISLLYKSSPQDLKLLLIDPKTVELAPYNELPHLLSPVISDPQAASAALKWVTKEMDQRYERLAAAGARNIEQFNQKATKAGDYANKMPYIVVIIDELADLMMVSSSEVQDYIVRITQKARAAGIHLLIATQRPSVDVVTGLIKNNIPTRVAFMVSSQIDSRTILDHSGAERLLGRGDMLFLGNGKSSPVRLQGAYIDEEIDDITDFIREQAAPHYAFNPTELKEKMNELNSEDELMDDVLEFLANEDSISTSKLQRMFSIGYNRAATIIDQLESSGYISGSQGSKPREVFYHGDNEDDSEE